MAWEWQCDPSNAGQVLSKYSIVGLLHKATEICLNKPDLLSNGFRRSGICPFNPRAPDRDKLLPATIFEGVAGPDSSNLPDPSYPTDFEVNLGSDDTSPLVPIQSDESSEILEHLTSDESVPGLPESSYRNTGGSTATPSSVCVTSPDMQSADSDMDYSSTKVSALNIVQDLCS